MKVLISGGTGLIGGALIQQLLKNGHQVVCLTRSAKEYTSQSGMDYLVWNGTKSGGWMERVGSTDVIINLAGDNLGSGRWTMKKKQRILQSRLDAGFALSEFAIQSDEKPKIFIQSSAIGIYGTDLLVEKKESSQPGHDYLTEVAKEWEHSSIAVEQVGITRAIIRTGVVLDRKEGALSRMLLPFQMFIGGPIGNGKQWLSWIHLMDEVGAIQFIMEKGLGGIFNLVAPKPVTNAQMGKAIAKVLHRPFWFPVPGFLLRLALGEMSTLVLDGQKVLPARLTEAGYEYKFPDLESALRDTLGVSK